MCTWLHGGIESDCADSAYVPSVKYLQRKPIAGARCYAAIVIFIAPGMAVAAADAYPVKPIRIIVPSSSGSGPDILARLTGAVFTQAWGQQVVADNRAGAAGNIGAEIAARAAPDGYTLLAASSQQISGPLYHEKSGYNLLRDFSPICLIASTPYVLSVHPSVAATSVKELIALAHAKPGTLHFGSSGAGGGPHLAAELLKSLSGLNFVHVPYKAATFALIDLAGGQVQFAFTVLPAVLPMIKTGRVRALGVTSLKRTPLAPELEAIAETVPGYEALGWYGLVAPVKTPQRIIAMLNAAIVRALKSSEFLEKLRALGTDPLGTTPQAFTKFMLAQEEATRKTMEMAGLRSN